MAAEKIVYPMMPVSHWWKLRAKFRQSIPGLVTDRYLASTLGMKVESARSNVLPSLRQTGLIDDDGKPTDLAVKWRDDTDYPEVCETIKKNVYPKELLDACPDPVSDRGSAERWFASKTKLGTTAVNKMIAVYSIVCQSDPTSSKVRVAASKQPAKNSVKKKSSSAANGKTVKPKKPLSPIEFGNTPLSPDININVQIHISADSSADQIDEIFASMAKHIYGKTTKP